MEDIAPLVIDPPTVHSLPWYRSVCRATYFVGAHSAISSSAGTAFLVTPRHLVTAGHVLHPRGEFIRPVHQHAFVIPASRLTAIPRATQIIAIDEVKDLGLLRLDKPLSVKPLQLARAACRPASMIGAVTFEGSIASWGKSGPRHELKRRDVAGSVLDVIEYVDDLVPLSTWLRSDLNISGGASGAAGIAADGTVVGVHAKTIDYLDPTTTPPPREGLRSTALWVPVELVREFLAANNVAVK